MHDSSVIHFLFPKMNRYAEWVHCNKCMEFSFKKENEILIGECGHFCCKKCLLYGTKFVLMSEWKESNFYFLLRAKSLI